jgi:hypothetical protein
MAATGYGITISFASGFLAEIIDTTPPEMSREAIDTSHTATTDGAMTFIPSDLIDYGECTVELNFAEGTTPPIDDPAEAVTITFASGATWAFSGFLTGYAPAAPIDDRMTATATIKVSGAITITGA